MADRPNVVLICVDAWRYDALGAAPDQHWLARYGLTSRLHTPNLDRLAGESAYFSRAVATAPHTTPSHASILTGLFPPQHGVRSFLFERLPGSIETLAERLGRAGYRCLALREAEDPAQRGLLQKADLLRGFSLVHELPELVSAAQGAQAAGQPVLAFLHLWDVHAPYLYSEAARREGQLDPYEAHCTVLARRWRVEPPAAGRLSERAAMEFQRRVAEAIGEVEERIRTLFEWYLQGVAWFDAWRWPAVEAALRAAGLWEGALLFLFGDHGEGVHPDGTGVHVFDHGHSLLDDVLRVPLLVRGLPGGAGRCIDGQVSLVDLVPTVLDVLGLPHRPELPGRSLAQLDDGRWTMGEESRDGPVHYAELCRGGPGFNLVRPSPQLLYQCCVRDGRYKVLGHCPPVLMRRYRRLPDRLTSMVHRLSSVVRPEARNRAELQPPLRRWYWTDLVADPDEEWPHTWSARLPEGVTDLRSACEALVGAGIRGPAIDLAAFEESAVLERLAGLGYVQR